MLSLIMSSKVGGACTNCKAPHWSALFTQIGNMTNMYSMIFSGKKKGHMTYIQSASSFQLYCHNRVVYSIISGPLLVLCGAKKNQNIFGES